MINFFNSKYKQNEFTEIRQKTIENCGIRFFIFLILIWILDVWLDSTNLSTNNNWH